MPAVLIANAAATFFMTGLIWLVQLVLYPVLGRVGEDRFEAAHALESRRITWIVLPAMTVELVTSVALVFDRPDGVGAVPAWCGAVAAVSVWAVTGLVQVPAHARLTPGRVPCLVAGNWLRTALWSGHAGVVVAMLAASLA